MSEVTGQEGLEVNPTPDVPEVSEAESRARAQGWVPKDEWNGEGKWRDAEEFLDRGELFAKMSDIKRSAQAEIRRTQQAFQVHLETVRKAEYNRALTAVRAELREAKREGDVDAEFAAEDKMRAIEAEHRAQQAEIAQMSQTHSNDPDPAFADWQSRNQWYGPQNPAMQTYADAVGRQIADQSRGSMSASEILKEVEARVRREFPHKFTNPNREKPGAVESSSRGSTKAEAYNLTPLERKIMNELVAAKVLTKEQYIADIKAKAGN